MFPICSPGSTSAAATSAVLALLLIRCHQARNGRVASPSPDEWCEMGWRELSRINGQSVGVSSQ
jgi:hypothetical protein